MDRVCAVVVTYFPTQCIVENVKLLAEQADEVVVVDNGSDGACIECLKHLQGIGKVRVIWNGKNLGIAAALNIGARYAIEHAYPWLATFDQDSRVPPGYFKSIFASLGSIKMNARPAILSPVFYDEAINKIWSDGDGRKINDNYSEIDAAINSGCVINSALFAEVGFFDEDLFIDYVDFDFCLRCRQSGHKIIQVCSVVLNHNLGCKAVYNVLGKSIATSNHNSVRRYYITRNRLIVHGRYLNSFPRWVLRDIGGFFKDCVKILAFEERKFDKSVMIILGGWHALINKRGIFATSRKLK